MKKFLFILFFCTKLSAIYAQIQPLTDIPSIPNISVYNFTGNKVMETSETRIDISQLKSGIYILKAIVDNDVLTKKVIK